MSQKANHTWPFNTSWQKNKRFLVQNIEAQSWQHLSGTSKFSSDTSQAWSFTPLSVLIKRHDLFSLTGISVLPIILLSSPQMSMLQVFWGENSWLYKHYTFDFSPSRVSSNWNRLHETHGSSDTCWACTQVTVIYQLVCQLFKRKWLSCPPSLLYMTIQPWGKGLKVVTKNTYTPKRSPHRECIFNEKGTKIFIISKKSHHNLINHQDWTFQDTNVGHLLL